MRIDLISIFPAYFDALALSLPGKARAAGLLDLAVHDLRDWATDRHRTVDDTPYGGGAGMVMLAEPWGGALDDLAPDGAVLVVPTPSGRVLHQALAHELAGEAHLVFACGRYEGIDQRVLDHAAGRLRVVEVSLGDFVLNGGEVAALAILEAVVRLLPGFMGNPASLVEESHGADGLLEYPVYSKPASWRGHDVPPVLLSGDHARIAAWRAEQALLRTAVRRPDLAHPSRTVHVEGAVESDYRLARAGDVGELWTLQRACWWTESVDAHSFEVPAMVESIDDVRAGLDAWTTFVLRSHGRLIGSVRGRQDDDAWWIGRLMVAPDLQRRGLGRWLLGEIESAAPPGVRRLRLITGAASARNLAMYRRAGYRPERDQPDPAIVALSKRSPQRPR